MARRLGLLLAALCLTACSPDLDRLVQFLAEHDAEALAQGQPCWDLAGDVAWRGLPDHFVVVIWRESRCNPNAVSPAGAIGLTQIMPFWLEALCPLGIACTRADLAQPGPNLDAAAYVYAVQGPSAWSSTW